MLYERLVDKSPQSIQYRDGYGNTLDKLARVYEELERWDKAIESYRSARRRRVPSRMAHCHERAAEVS